MIMTTTASTQREAYLKHLLDTASPQAIGGVWADLQSAACALVQEQTLPSTRDEEWRFTDLSDLLAVSFQPVAGYDAEAKAVAAGIVAQTALLEAAHSQIVWANGCWMAEQSDVSGLPVGVWVGSLRTLADRPEVMVQIQARLAQIPGQWEVFTALNTAGFQDAVVVWIPRNQVVEVPIHLIYGAIATSVPTLIQPRCLVVAEANSSVTLVESFVGEGDQPILTNSVTEIYLDPGAQVTHIRLQQESATTTHLGKTAICQAQDSRYITYGLALGSQLSRHTLGVHQTGAQTETQLYGLSAISANQVADTHSTMLLTQPHGAVTQLHKCIVDDHAHAVFSGKIFVAREAQLTNASQLNRNLLLSNGARVDTKPQLDIVADNVKCAHGATVSQLDEDELFYLQSRGVSADVAQQLLIYGFTMEIIEKLPIASLRERLTQTIRSWQSAAQAKSPS